MVNLGGDPYETISASIQKYGKYLIKYDRRKSAYYYKDLTQVEGGGLYDLHTLDFDRVTDSGSAKVWLTHDADIYFTFDRFTRKGAGTTTQYIGREVFPFDKPVQEESRQAAVGLNLHFNRYSFVLEEKYLNFKSDNSYFLPGATDGGVGAEFPTALNDYFLNDLTRGGPRSIVSTARSGARSIGCGPGSTTRSRRRPSSSAPTAGMWPMRE